MCSKVSRFDAVNVSWFKGLMVQRLSIREGNHWFNAFTVSWFRDLK